MILFIDQLHRPRDAVAQRADVRRKRQTSSQGVARPAHRSERKGAKADGAAQRGVRRPQVSAAGLPAREAPVEDTDPETRHRIHQFHDTGSTGGARSARPGR